MLCRRHKCEGWRIWEIELYYLISYLLRLFGAALVMQPFQCSLAPYKFEKNLGFERPFKIQAALIEINIWEGHTAGLSC